MRTKLIALLLLSPVMAHAGIKVVATTSDIGAIVKEVGSDAIDLTVLAKGTQDPHYLEAKPSYMVKMRDADLLVANGLSLEVGWLPSLQRGARNPKLAPGGSGYIELGPLVDPIEIPKEALTRAMGDVHPEGNPHFTLDPIRVGEAAEKLAIRLSEVDPPNKAGYLTRARAFKERLAQKVKEWKSRIEKSGVKKLVTYHPSLNYFLARYDLEALAYLEPKPGIPPTAQHVIDTIAKMKAEKVRLILVDNFFDTKVADRISRETNARVARVGIAVESSPELKTIIDVQEGLVRAVEGK